MTSRSEHERRSPLPKPWAITVAVSTGLCLVATLVVGVWLASGGGQTPKESYILSVILALLSILAGWIGTVIAEQMRTGVRGLNDENDRHTLNQVAESAVQRIFVSLSALGRIQELSAPQASSIGSAPERLRRSTEIAAFAFTNLGHSVDDWHRLAPDVVDKAFTEAAKPKNYRQTDPSGQSSDGETEGIPENE